MSPNEGGGGMSQFGDILLTAFLLLAEVQEESNNEDAPQQEIRSGYQRLHQAIVIIS
jgi:hypothetical protein